MNKLFRNVYSHSKFGKFFSHVIYALKDRLILY